MTSTLTTSPETDTNPDLVWIRQTKAGDSKAFSHLVSAYQTPVYNLCYQKLGNAADAEDAAQETFIRAYLKLDSYDETRPFSSWLFAIASNYCIDKLRQTRAAPLAWDDLATWAVAEEFYQPEAILSRADAQAEVRTLVDELPSAYQHPIILKYWYDLSYQEIAQNLDTTVSAIKNRLFRARRMLSQAVN